MINSRMRQLTKEIKFPFYAKIAFIFISLFAFVYTMSVAQDIIIPLIYATIAAILLNPVVNFFVRCKINRTLAIAITLSVALIFVGSVFYLIFSRITHFSEIFPMMKEKFILRNAELINWFSEQTNIAEPKIHNYLINTIYAEFNKLSFGDNFIKIGHIAVTVVLLPIYLGMLLFYKPHLLDFIKSLFKQNDHLALSQVLFKTRRIIQSYVVGLFMETVVIAILNSIGLAIIGIENAILLGCLGALLNIIPYVGAIIASTIFMIVALLTKTPIFMLYVLVMYIIVQIIDNSFLLPKVVASRVRINALISVIVVIIGGTIWGVPGMFLAIPLTAIFKVVLDHIDYLKPWGYLLGDKPPDVSKYSLQAILSIKKRWQEPEDKSKIQIQ